MRTGMENMVFALTSGQETTAQATADLNQLESDFMFMKGLGVDEMMMPRHNRERFMGFLTWCFLEAHRGASMISLCVVATHAGDLWSLEARRLHPGSGRAAPL